MPDKPAQDAILFKEIEGLREKVKLASLPRDLEEKTSQMLTRLVRVAKFGGYSQEYERVADYIDWLINLPWEKKTKDVLDLKRVREILNNNHYDLEEIKERILEYLAVLKLHQEKGTLEEQFSRAPILCLVGLVGTGKTTLGFSIAQSLGRKFSRIPFGGISSALDLRGQSRLHAEAEPGLVIKALRRVEVGNPVILLDEIDRVTQEGRADVMGVLVELLDPEQNSRFFDYYLDFPIDLSEVFFIATANNTTNIATAVLDRLEILQMPSYSDQEKIVIGCDFVLPKALKEAGLTAENLKIDKDLWPKIVRPLGFDAGIRTLKRTIEGICRRVAKMVVEDKGKSFIVNEKNFKEFLPELLSYG